MKIIEINVNEFGCLKDMLLRPSEEFNLIYGENESGKSTLLLFIKFMLYGLGRRSASNSERERSLSWSGKRAAGSLTFEHNDKRYRIERNFSGSGRNSSDSVSVICLDDGSELNTDKTPGEYFLGVPKEVFESSACVGQMRSTEINGEKTAASIENILSTADESVDTAKVLKNLDALRVIYRHKNRNGGSLWEDENRISALKAEADRARETALLLEQVEQRLDHSRAEYLDAKKSFDDADALLGKMNKISIIKRFEKLRDRQKELDELEIRRKQLTEELRCGDFVPDRSYTAEIKLCARSLSDAQKHCEAKRQEFDLKVAQKPNEESAVIGEKILREGGKNAILSRAAEIEKKVGRFAYFSVLTMVISTVAAVAAAALMAFFGAWGAVALAVTAISLSMFFALTKAKKTAKRAFEELVAEYGADASDMSGSLDRFIEAYEIQKEFASRKEKLENELKYAENELESKKKVLRDLLSKTVKDPEPTIETAAVEFKRIEMLLSQFENTERDFYSLRRTVTSEREELSHYDEAGLRAQISAELSGATMVEISEAERTRAFFAEKLRIIGNKISALENDLISRRAGAKDPLPIADELAELSEKYRRDSEFYDALTLAMDSIESASNAMRGNVTPAISRDAAQMLSKVFDGRYSGVLTTGTLGISLEKDGYTVKSDWLSGGTRDAAYLALRLSLFMRIYEGSLPPLILDESLCQLDDSRAKRMLALLFGFAQRGVQIFLLTSHKREEEICNLLGFEPHKIVL